jgi:DNA polymerase-3 subunit delta
MSVAAQRQLRSAIDDRRFDPVYYFSGGDDYRKDEAVAQLVVAAVDPATADFNLDTFRAADVDAERLDVALSSLPMLAQRRVVVLRDVGALKKAARAVLDRYLSAPAADTTLVLTSISGAKVDAAIVARATAVPFPALDSAQVMTWLAQHARKLGVQLSDDSAALLADAVGADLAHAAGEIDKLASYTGGRPISAADVEAIVGLRRGETVADLLDAVAARDGARAVSLVAAVLAHPKTSAVPVVNNLAVQALAMSWARAARDSGLSASRVESELFRLLKSGGAFPGRPWSDAVKCWSRNLARWSRDELKSSLDHLLAADLALKDSRVSSEEGVVMSLVLALCAAAQNRVAA